ncbi:MAG: PTS sugar transporter subunit IIC, partial [Bacilli bacterium]
MEQPTKNISTYIVKILNGMAQGLFASLIIGLIIKQIGLYLNATIVIQLGQIAQYMMGPAIGVGVALSVGAPPLAIFASAIVGAIGAGTFVFEASFLSKVIIGEPVGALLAALVGAEVGKKIAG